MKNIPRPINNSCYCVNFYLFFPLLLICIYPQNECYSLEGIDEVYEFLRLKKSMEMVGFTADLQKRYLIWNF